MSYVDTIPASEKARLHAFVRDFWDLDDLISEFLERLPADGIKAMLEDADEVNAYAD